MRVVIFFMVWVLTQTAASALAEESRARTPLEACLANRLDAVLAGDNVARHASMSAVVKNAIGRGNANLLDTLPKSVHDEFEALAIQLISKRIAERGTAYRGSAITLAEHSIGRNSAEGYITTPDDSRYSFGVSFTSPDSCRIMDLSVEGLFTLRSWLAKQDEFVLLMDTYNMKQ